MNTTEGSLHLLGGVLCRSGATPGGKGAALWSLDVQAGAGEHDAKGVSHNAENRFMPSDGADEACWAQNLGFFK
jgi:hypothetical protein